MDKPWHVLARRYIYESDWMNLQHVDVQLPDGSIVEKMHLIDFPFEAAGVVPIGVDGRVLLIDHYRFQTDTRGWEIPAGKIDAGETPETAVARELLEESGHRAETFTELGRYHPSNGSSNQVFHIFVGRGVTRVGEILDTNEVLGLCWFTPAEIRELVARNELLDGLSLTGILWAMAMGIIVQ
jgi:8-oxo-dGTP pyrophosphatase MutT (NUDIX family)